MLRIRKRQRPHIRRDRLRRRYQGQTSSGFRVTTLGDGNGNVKGTRKGFLFVRDIASADADGNNTYGAAYQLPIDTNATIQVVPKRQVRVGLIDGQEYIIGMVQADLVASGVDPHQFNTADPSTFFKQLAHISDLQAFPDGDGTIMVHPCMIRKPDGNYVVFGGETGIDIITSNTPGTDMQVVICQWYDTTTEALTYTVSNEVSKYTDLKLSPSTALTYINQCAALAPAGALGVWSWIIDDDTTAITINNKFIDIRDFIGAGLSSTPNYGTETTKTISSGVVATGTDRNLIVAAETGTSDDLVEITGLNIGDKVLLRADTGDTITVKHNSGSATIKILIQDDADFVLDEVHPLELVLLSTNALAQVFEAGGASELSDLSDVGTTTPTDGNVLIADGDSWESGVLDVEDLSIGSGTTYDFIWYDGTQWNILKNTQTTTAPDADDDLDEGYDIGSLWIDTVGANAYICVDKRDGIAVWPKITGNGLYASVAILSDTKATTTDGGSSSATTWNARDLNTEDYDPDGIVSISSNQFTPIAGDYEIEVKASVYKGDKNRLRLYNVTDTSAVQEGLSSLANNPNNDQTTATLTCKFTADGSDAYRIDHYTTIARATNGLGLSIDDGSSEVYMTIILRKLA